MGLGWVALLIVFAAVIGSTAMMGVIACLLHRIRQMEAVLFPHAGICLSLLMRSGIRLIRIQGSLLVHLPKRRSTGP